MSQRLNAWQTGLRQTLRSSPAALVSRGLSGPAFIQNARSRPDRGPVANRVPALLCLCVRRPGAWTMCVMHVFIAVAFHSEGGINSLWGWC